MTNAENETKTIKTTYLTSNYFVRNGNSSKPFTLTYGNENSSILMPAGKAIYANVLGNNVLLSAGSGGGECGIPDFSKPTNVTKTITIPANAPSGTQFNLTYTAPTDGWIYIHPIFNYTNSIPGHPTTSQRWGQKDFITTVNNRTTPNWVGDTGSEDHTWSDDAQTYGSVDTVNFYTSFYPVKKGDVIKVSWRSEGRSFWTVPITDTYTFATFYPNR